MKNSIVKKAVLTAVLVSAGITLMYGVPQSGSLQKGLEAGYSEISGAMTTIKNIIYAVAGVIGLIGAVKVYGKWSEGAPDTSKVAGLWFGGAAFLVVAAIVIDNLFIGK
jgi:hypothetical protein